MSKGNMMLGYARGKVGSLVFARRKGEQITRAYNANPNNPRSTAQMLQRMKWANLVAFYRATQPKLKMAFENKPTGLSDFNAFMSANLGKTAVYLTKQQVNDGAAVISPYIISRGSLAPGINVSLETGRVNFYLKLSGSTAFEGSSAQDYLDYFNDVNAANGFVYQYGDQLTFFVAVQYSDEQGIPRVGVNTAKFVLGVNTFAEIRSAMGSLFTFDDNSNIAVSLAGDVPYAATVIVSRSQNGTLLTSDAALMMNVLPAALFNDLGLQPFEVVARTYGWTDQAYLDPSDEVALAGASAPESGDDSEEGGV